jgi:ABC-2 type transport system permease protein
VLSVATTIVVGIVLAWSVGREFVDGTVTSLFAQPVDRVVVAGAKVAVALAWAVGCCVVVAGELLVVAVVSGAVLDGLAGPTARLVVVSLLGVVLALPTAWVATVAKSYLGAIAALMGLIVVTQVVTAAGAGRWWPWAAPSLWVGMGGPEARAGIGPLQLALVAPVALLSLLALGRWWRRLELR